jgi:signal transduction histidine kinase/ActR/RegA family two-component response regulator
MSDSDARLTALERARARERAARKQAERLLEDKSRELYDANLALQRTNRELEEARDRAEAATRSQATFLANMSHEIRTPLNGVIGLADLLAETPLRPEQARFVQTLQDSARLLLGIVNDVLEVSKIESGRLLIEEVEFDLPMLLDSLRCLHAPQANDKGIELRILMEPATGRVRGDPHRLGQVISNVVANAIKFTHAGHVEVAVARSGTICRFTVTDTGIGIPTDARQRLFSKFMQADASTTRKYGGTGLGLAICKGIVEAMGGRIGVDSDPGQGSTIWFEVELEATAAATLGELRVTRPADRPSLSGRVLLVEDNPVNQLVMSRMLGRYGLHVETAENGRLAVERLSVESFDLVFMDCQMPVMDGYQATQLIRDPSSAVLRHDIPVVALTAAAMTEDRQRCLQAGMDGYLAKPVVRPELEQTLVTHLRPAAAAAQ